MTLQVDRFEIMDNKKNPVSMKTLNGTFIQDHATDQPVVYINWGNNNENQIIAEEIIRILEEYLLEVEGDG